VFGLQSTHTIIIIMLRERVRPYGVQADDGLLSSGGVPAGHEQERVLQPAVGAFGAGKDQLGTVIDIAFSGTSSQHPALNRAGLPVTG
jgi:hypothetical protein